VRNGRLLFPCYLRVVSLFCRSCFPVNFERELLKKSPWILVFMAIVVTIVMLILCSPCIFP